MSELLTVLYVPRDEYFPLKDGLLKSGIPIEHEKPQISSYLLYLLINDAQLSELHHTVLKYPAESTVTASGKPINEAEFAHLPEIEIEALRKKISNPRLQAQVKHFLGSYRAMYRTFSSWEKSSDCLNKFDRRFLYTILTSQNEKKFAQKMSNYALLDHRLEQADFSNVGFKTFSTIQSALQDLIDTHNADI